MIIPENERLDFLVSLLEDGNGAAFARKIGCDKSRITEIRKGTRGIGFYRDRIVAAYPVMENSQFMETGDIGDFPLVALVSYFARENQRLLGLLENR